MLTASKAEFETPSTNRRAVNKPLPNPRGSRLYRVKKTMNQAYAEVRRPWLLIHALLLLTSSVVFFPSDLEQYPVCTQNCDEAVLYVADHYVRFVDTIVQIAMPIGLRDWVGLTQVLYIGLSTTAATHGLKRLLNDWHVSGTRLGQRPWGATSKHNMPSGHTSMASCATWFVCRRYALWHALYLMPILLLTMYARVLLNQHTVTSVLVGCSIGFVMAALFTSPYERFSRARQPVDNRPRIALEPV